MSAKDNMEGAERLQMLVLARIANVLYPRQRGDPSLPGKFFKRRR
jgi:hypothetical protein